MGTGPFDACATQFVHFKREQLHAISNKLTIYEADKGGKGEVEFEYNLPCARFLPGKQPIKWLKNQKCADGAFIIFDGSDVHLHIVELKSRLVSSEWIKAIEQFEGMLLNALAMKSIINVDRFTSITCHISFTDDQMSPSRTTLLSGLKMGLGTRPPVSGSLEWLYERLSLLNAHQAKVVKIQRDANGVGRLKI